MSNNVDLTKPVSFRVPMDYREAFKAELRRQKVTPTELAQRLVIRGLLEDDSAVKEREFVLKNVAFLTQLVSELLDKVDPDGAKESREAAQQRTRRIVESVLGANHG